MSLPVLPCPHCESAAFVAHYTSYYKVRCSNGNCAACGGSAQTPEEAISLWNKRPKTFNLPSRMRTAAEDLDITPEEYNKIIDQLFEEEIFNPIIE